mgnify:CR=1 FL=1
MKTCAICDQKKYGSHASYCSTCYNSYKREWYLNNRDKEIKRCSDYNKKNPHVAARSMMNCRKNRPEFYREYKKQYLKNNPTRDQLYSKNKRAMKRCLLPCSPIKHKDWIALLGKFNSRCFYCRKKFRKLEMDHVIPLSRGGEHSIRNVVPACRLCNQRKNMLTDLEFASISGRLCW